MWPHPPFLNTLLSKLSGHHTVLVFLLPGRLLFLCYFSGNPFLYLLKLGVSQCLIVSFLLYLYSLCRQCHLVLLLLYNFYAEKSQIYIFLVLWIPVANWFLGISWMSNRYYKHNVLKTIHFPPLKWLNLLFFT